MQKTLYVDSSSQTLTYYSWRENVQMSSLTNKTGRKGNLTSHQRVHTSKLALDIKQNAFQTHLTQC